MYNRCQKCQVTSSFPIIPNDPIRIDDRGGIQYSKSADPCVHPSYQNEVPLHETVQSGGILRRTKQMSLVLATPIKRHHFNFAACAGHLTAFKCLLEIGAPTSVDGAVVSTVFYTALPSTTTLPSSGFCCHKSLTERRRIITVRL